MRTSYVEYLISSDARSGPGGQASSKLRACGSQACVAPPAALGRSIDTFCLLLFPLCFLLYTSSSLRLASPRCLSHRLYPPAPCRVVGLLAVSSRRRCAPSPQTAKANGRRFTFSNHNETAPHEDDKPTRGRAGDLACFVSCRRPRRACWPMCCLQGGRHPQGRDGCLRVLFVRGVQGRRGDFRRRLRRPTRRLGRRLLDLDLRGTVLTAFRPLRRYWLWKRL